MRITYNAPVVLTFALISGAVLLGDTLFGGVFTTTIFSAPGSFSVFSPFDYVRIVAHIAGHANLAHLMGNFMLILLIGPLLEEKYGSWPLCIMILVTAATTGILNAAFFETGVLGASGIVFMMIILSSITEADDGEIPLTFILVIALYVFTEIVGSFAKDGVSQFSHIMGGICGSIFGFLLMRNR